MPVLVTVLDGIVFHLRGAHHFSIPTNETFCPLPPPPICGTIPEVIDAFGHDLRGTIPSEVGLLAKLSKCRQGGNGDRIPNADVATASLLRLLRLILFVLCLLFQSIRLLLVQRSALSSLLALSSEPLGRDDPSSDLRTSFEH